MKRKIVLIISILFIVIAGLLLYFLVVKPYQEEQSLIKEISSCYHKIVKVNKNTYLLDKKKNQSLIVYKDLILELESISEKSTDEYFKIKDLPYYINYKDVDKKETKETYNKHNQLTKYIKLPIKITTTNTTVFYQEEKELFCLNTTKELDAYFQDDKYYYVSLNDNIYQVKKDSITSKSLEKGSEYLNKISIFYITDLKNIEEKLNYLKEKNYKSISLDDFMLYKEDNIELESNSVMIFVDESLDTSILTKDFIYNKITKDFKEGDSQVNKTSKDLTYYKLTSTTTLSRFKDMLNGKKEVKITTTTTNSDPNSSVAVLNYHFFYSSSNNESCNESICLDTKNFEEQLKYLKDNNIDTLTMQEYVDWIYGRKVLTKKSVLITVDDGAMGTNTHLPDLLDKYDSKATLFLISGWWPMSKYRTGNLEIQSHTHDLHHNNYKRDGKTGIKTVMISYDELMKDLSLSVNTVGTNLAFCYPFYAYNSILVQAVKDTGFQVAFVGGNKKSTRNSDKYKIPRYIIYKNTSLSSFKNMVN